MSGREYCPPWWCRQRHLQTVWGPLFRRGRVPLRRERLITSDGDFVDLDWLDAAAPPGDREDRRAGEAACLGPPAPLTRRTGAGLPPGPRSGAPTQAPDGTGRRVPILVVLHGLEGSSRSHYVTGLVREAAARGWTAVVLNFRSCSGELNRLPRFYHSGDTGDLDAVVAHLLHDAPDARLGAVGVSLGGNVLLKWLGERGEGAPPGVRAAAAISAPLDLVACARAMDRGFARAVYTRNFLRTMRRKVRQKARLFPGFVDVRAVRRARTFAEYDRAMTAPVHGFRDEVDYWERSSSGPYLASIRRPTLLVNALDDPFVPAASLPDPASLPGWVRAEYVPHGGHVGFIEGAGPWCVSSWAERRAMDFLGAQLEVPGPDAGPRHRTAEDSRRPDAAGPVHVGPGRLP